ncbi:hypothetical protein [Nocardia amamiensis]|uniref:hypothetical protein n=1 Tax=Nocardia amamiensis TaxID=404578 RepID=UPI00082FF7D9|nr:hypothetical protein [Nocardia amamiensis]
MSTATFLAAVVAVAALCAGNAANTLLPRMSTADWLTRRPETDAERADRARTDQRRTYHRFTPDGHRDAPPSNTKTPTESAKPMRQPMIRPRRHDPGRKQHREPAPATGQTEERIR